MTMRGILAAVVCMGGLSTSIPDARAQGTGEFQQNFYNANRCIQTREANVNGTRTIFAKNLCGARVAALVCFQNLRETKSIGATGWLCDFSDLYEQGVERRVSYGGFYSRKIKTAACAAANDICVQVVRSIQTRVAETRSDPEPVGHDLRKQFGLVN